MVDDKQGFRDVSLLRNVQRPKKEFGLECISNYIPSVHPKDLKRYVLNPTTSPKQHLDTNGFFIDILKENIGTFYRKGT